MWTLTKIYLHNWHRFQRWEQSIKDSLYLAGHNGSGKSSVLDAIQVVLIGDLNQIRFNSSAQTTERSHRTLDSYVRGKSGQDFYLRRGNTIAYIALEFRDVAADKYRTIGVCIESSPEKNSVERTYFILQSALNPAVFWENGREKSRRALRDTLKRGGRQGDKSYDQVKEYQDDLLLALGGLNKRFFELFVRALNFTPIKNIREFVEQWLLEEQPLDVANLQKVVENLEALRLQAERVVAQQSDLQQIVTHQKEIERFQGLEQRFSLTVEGLYVEVARQRVTLADNRVAQCEIANTNASQRHEEADHEREQAREALQEAKRQRDDSDVRRQQRDLNVQLEHLKQQYDARNRQWRRVVRDAHTVAQQLENLPPMLKPDVFASVHDSTIAILQGVHVEQPPSPALAEAVTTLFPLVDSHQQELIAERTRLQDQLKTLKQEAERLRSELKKLEAGKITYPPHVETVRARLAAQIGIEPPPLLSELLEIQDLRWQNAIEALLGARRLNIMIEPRYFSSAVDVLDQLRAKERLYDVGLVDLGKVKQEGRAAQPNSLATKIITRVPLVRPYIDHLLGDVILCETPAELRQYRRSVTPEVLYYHEWTVRAINPKNYSTYYIGKQARIAQIQQYQSDLATNAEEQQRLQTALAPLAQAAELLRQALTTLGTLARDVAEPIPNPADLLPEIEAVQAALNALDLSSLVDLEARIQQLQTALKQREQQLSQCFNEMVKASSELKIATQEQSVAHYALTPKIHTFTQKMNALPELVAEIERMLEERSTREPGEAARQAESAAKGYATQAATTREAFIQSGAAYNTKFDFRPASPDYRDNSYTLELERLIATELPRFQNQIAEAESEAQEELREHVLHRLYEQVENAKLKLNQLNDALRPLKFRDDSYLFVAHPDDELRDYYDLLSKSQLLGKGTLFESMVYAENRLVFEDFFRALTRTPETERERRTQAKLTDYRSYLTYDIQVTHVDGEKSSLSKIMGQTSGGETQTPFYLAIAASFVQLYHIYERQSRSTIRLVAFDEAFSKMDQTRIGATLDLFHQFKLQIITATPLERCEYLVPKMCTNLVISANRTHVHVEPYQNYHAQLDNDTP